MSSRRTRPEIRVKSVQFSPTGRAWAAVTTEGLLIYTLDAGVTFDPFDLTEDVTPETIVTAIGHAHYSSAIMMSLKLNERHLVVKSVEAVPVEDGEGGGGERGK